MAAAALTLLVAGLLVAGADAQDCECFSLDGPLDMEAVSRVDDKYFGSATNDYMPVDSDPDAENTCLPPDQKCTFHFKYTGTDLDVTKAGWSVLSLRCDLGDTGSIAIYSGRGTADTPQIVSSCYNNDSSVNINVKGTEMIVVISGSQPNVKFYGYAEPIDYSLLPTDSPSSSAVSSTVPTTSPGTASPISGDVAKLGLDLAIAIDATYLEDNTVFPKMQKFAVDLTSDLPIHAVASSGKGSRASLLWLLGTEMGSSSALWSFDNSTFLADAINGFQQFPAFAGNASYGKALESFIKNGFDVDGNDGYSLPPRPHAERILVILTAKDSVDSGTDLHTPIDNNDVHTILVNFAADPPANLITMLGTSFYTAPDTDPVNLLKYILDGNQLCGQKDMTGPDANGVYVMESPNFRMIELGDPDNAENGRYCNFQKQTFKIPATGTQKFIKLKAIYELETEQDKLRVFNNAKLLEEAVWSGFDIDAAEICFGVTKNDQIEVEFTSNGEQVFRGFQVRAKFVNACTDEIA